MFDDPTVYIVGGAGYIGTRLTAYLIADGWAPQVIDAGIYDNVDHPQDVRDIEPPGDGHPVVWLASLHKEPPDFLQFSKEDQRLWITTMLDIMVTQPTRWIKAGHPLLYISSMQVVSPQNSAYAMAKRTFEATHAGQRGVQIFRFGTVWGGLNEDPLRLETAINRALLGHKLDKSYSAHITHIQRALDAISYALTRPYLATIENVIDADDPVTGEAINAILETPPGNRSTWAKLFWAESQRSKYASVVKNYRTSLQCLSSYYSLPTEAQRVDSAGSGVSEPDDLGRDLDNPAGDNEVSEDLAADESVRVGRPDAVSDATGTNSTESSAASESSETEESHA